MLRNAPGRIVRLPHVLVVAVVVLASACLTACGGGSGAAGSSGTPAGGAGLDRLSLLVPMQGDALDTTKASIGSLGVLLLGLEPLTVYDPASGDFENNLATSVEQEGPLVYRFRIRAGVKFWDGKPLTAEDVVFSFDLHRGKSASFIAQQWAGVDSVEATAPDEVTVKLAQPNPQFAFAIAGTGIVQKAYYEANRKQIGNPQTLNMGTGPYRFESFKPSSETVLRRNEDYWGTKPPIAELELRTIADDAQRLLAIQSGEVDGIVGIPLAQLPSFERIPGLQLSEGTDYSVYKFNFDLTKAPWDDPHLRRAFAHAVNRTVLADDLFKGNAEAAVTLVPPSVMSQLLPQGDVEAGYAEIEQTVPAYDLEAAKRELAESSVPDGVATTLLITGSDPNLAAIAQTAAQDLQQIGIRLEIKQVDDNTYYNAVYFKHTTDGVSLENFGADGPDPSNIPSSALDSRNGYPQGSGVNVSNYESPAVDDLLARSRKLKQDDPERAQLLVEAQAKAAADTAFVPLLYPKVYLGLRDGLEWPGFGTFWWLSRWPADVKAGS